MANYQDHPLEDDLGISEMSNEIRIKDVGVDKAELMVQFLPDFKVKKLISPQRGIKEL